MSDGALDFGAWAELSAALISGGTPERARLLSEARLSEARFAQLDAQWRATLAREERAGHAERYNWYRNLCAAVAAKVRAPGGGSAAARSPGYPGPRSAVQQTVDVEAARQALGASLPFRAAPREASGQEAPTTLNAGASPSGAPHVRAFAGLRELRGTVDVATAVAPFSAGATMPFAGPPAPHAYPSPPQAPLPPPSSEAPRQPVSAAAADPALLRESVEAYAALVSATLVAPLHVERIARGHQICSSDAWHRLHSDWAARMRKEPALVARYLEALRGRSG